MCMMEGFPRARAGSRLPTPRHFGPGSALIGPGRCPTVALGLARPGPQRLRHAADASVLREMIGFAAHRLMELETEARCGAAHGERSPDCQVQRSGRRDLYRETRAGWDMIGCWKRLVRFLQRT